MKYFIIEKEIGKSREAFAKQKGDRVGLRENGKW